MVYDSHPTGELPTVVTRLQTLRTLWKSPIASLVIYLGLLLICTWPLVRQANTSLAIGPVESVVVPMLNLWTIWWNAEQATHAFLGYWDAPIFYPTPDALAFSEPQPVTLIVAPILWITGSRVLAYNVYFWMSYLLNAIFTERLLRLRGVGLTLARAGGIAMLLLPVLQWNRDVIQLVPVWGILWVWIAFLKLSQHSRIKDGFELGLASATTCLMCMYYGLFLALLSLVTVWILVRNWKLRSTWVAWGTGIAVALVVAGPFLYEVYRDLKSHEFVRDPGVVSQLSLFPGDYTATWGVDLIPWGRMAAREHWRMSPGWIKTGLAGLGMALGLARRRTRRWTLFLTLTGGLAFLLSLGAHLKWGEFSLWEYLSRYVPGLALARSPFRFAVFVQVVSVLLAVQAVHVANLWVRRHRRWRFVVWPLIGTAAVLVPFETWPTRVAVTQVPDARPHQGWIEFVREQTPPGRGVLCLPFAEGHEITAFETTAHWMYFGTYHKARLVNGYSGFFPDWECQMRAEMATQGVTLERLDQLEESGVVFVVLDSQSESESAYLPPEGPQLKIVLEWSDPTGIQVYRLIRLP